MGVIKLASFALAIKVGVRNGSVKGLLLKYEQLTVQVLVTWSNI